MRPEDALLLECARTALDDVASERICSLAGAVIDWPYIVRAACQHRVLPLLYHNLRQTCPAVIPRETLALLARMYAASATNSLFLAGELLKLSGVLTAHEVRAIPYKGPVLAAAAYGNLALRPFDDLDILIAKADLPRAKRTLLGAGYRPHYQTIGANEAAYLRRHSDYPLLRQDGRVVIDLQWGISQRPTRFLIDIASIAGRALEITLAGKPMRVLPPEDTVLFLCVHGAKHLWERLVWICDVAECLRRWPSINWDMLRGQAARLGCERRLRTGLLLASELLDAPLPEDLLQSYAADPAARQLVAQVVSNLFRQDVDRRQILAEAPLFYLRMVDRVTERLRLSVFLAPGLMHPLRLLRRYGPRPSGSPIGRPWDARRKRP